MRFAGRAAGLSVAAVRAPVGVDAHGQDAPAARAVDPKPRVVVGVDLFAFARQAAEEPDRVAADRLEILGRQVGAELGVDVFDVRARFDDRFGLARRRGSALARPRRARRGSRRRSPRADLPSSPGRPFRRIRRRRSPCENLSRCISRKQLRDLLGLRHVRDRAHQALEGSCARASRSQARSSSSRS